MVASPMQVIESENPLLVGRGPGVGPRVTREAGGEPELEPVVRPELAALAQQLTCFDHKLNFAPMEKSTLSFWP